MPASVPAIATRLATSSSLVVRLAAPGALRRRRRTYATAATAAAATVTITMSQTRDRWPRPGTALPTASIPLVGGGEAAQLALASARLLPTGWTAALPTAAPLTGAGGCGTGTTVVVGIPFEVVPVSVVVVGGFWA
jgi:hypothetical protein